MTLTVEDIGLYGNHKTAAQVLVELIHARRENDRPGRDQDVAMAQEQLRAIQLAGATAAMFGGRQAQDRLFREVQAIDPDAAAGLDRLWDYVGEWLS